MPYTLTSQLQAVNIMLATIGEAPVATLTSPLTADASLAMACLDEHTKAVQSEGYPWNTDRNVTLAPDNNGNIWLASNVAKTEINPGRYPTLRPIVRPNAQGTQQLYDSQNQTFAFTTSLIADKVVYWLDWAQLPEPARRYILIKAARTFADRSVGAETIHQFTQADEMNAKREMDSARVDMNKMNILHSPDTEQINYRGGFGLIRF